MFDLRADDAPHVTFAPLVRKPREDDCYTLYQPGHGTSLDIEPVSAELVEAALSFFTEPATFDAFFAAHPGFPDDLLQLMVRSGFIVAEHERALLEHGFLRPAPHPIGTPWTWSDVPALASPGTFVVVGVPIDMAAAGDGAARHGPAEIRKVVNGLLLDGEGDVVDHDFKRLYPALSVSVADLGDIDPDGARLDHVGGRLRKVVGELVAAGMPPVVLGGDHSVTHFVLSELCERVARFGILHFDAHHDLGPSRTVSHANVFSSVLERAEVASIVQIGLRVIERVSPFASRVSCDKRTVVTARETRAGHARKVLESLPRDLPYYLSFDIDCIDASLAPETGTPAFAGLTFDQASELVDYVARTFQLIGADFVEVGGAANARNAAALMAAQLVERVLLGGCAFEPLSTDRYVL